MVSRARGAVHVLPTAPAIPPASNWVMVPIWEGRTKPLMKSERAAADTAPSVGDRRDSSIAAEDDNLLCVPHTPPEAAAASVCISALRYAPNITPNPIDPSV